VITIPMIMQRKCGFFMTIAILFLSEEMI
jgi:hypothetical protein